MGYTPLRGFVFCGICNKRLWAEQHTKKSGIIFQYYYCVNCRKNTYVDRDSLEKQIEKWFARIQISHEYAISVIEAAKQLLLEFREGKNQDRVILYNRKAKLEAAMRETEDNRFLKHDLTDDVFQKIYTRYQDELGTVNNQIQQLDSDHSETIDTIKKLFCLAENIGNSYKEAEPKLKRFFLDLFWEGFDVREGKIAKARLHNNVKQLISNGSVRVSSHGLPKPRLGIRLDLTPIIQVFQNVQYMGELRARWLEIKRLQAKPNLAVITT